MAQPFYALYVKNFGGDYGDTLSQIENVRAHMFDEEKKLCYHGYDNANVYIGFAIAEAFAAAGAKICFNCRGEKHMEAALKAYAEKGIDASNFVNGHVLYVDGGILAYIGKQP